MFPLVVLLSTAPAMALVASGCARLSSTPAAHAPRACRVIAIEPISTSMAIAFAAGALVPSAALASKSSEYSEFENTLAEATTALESVTAERDEWKSMLSANSAVNDDLLAAAQEYTQQIDTLKVRRCHAYAMRMPCAYHARTLASYSAPAGDGGRLHRQDRAAGGRADQGALTVHAKELCSFAQ